MFTTEYRILIKHDRPDKNMAVGQYANIMHTFPEKPWSASRLAKLIRNIDDTGGTSQN